MAQGKRVKDLEVYQGILGRDDLSIPVDAGDFITAKRITGKQMKSIIDQGVTNVFKEMSTLIEKAQNDIQVIKQEIENANTWVQGWN